MIIKPMLAETLEDPSSVNFPIIASPKLDGIRCIKTNNRALTRSFKPIPNNFIRTQIENNFPDGVDGEIMLADHSFNDISSAVMSENGTPDFIYYVFDYVISTSSLNMPYKDRLTKLPLLANIPNCQILPHKLINSTEELLKYENECIEAGYEGVMIRDPLGPYKCGCSTLKEGYLLKLKQFEHFEVVVTGFIEQMHNENKAEKNQLGLTKRSTAKAGLKPADTLGKFVVKSLAKVLDIEVGSELRIGSGEGLTKALRKQVWENKLDYVGKIIRCKYQSKGAKNKPRFITFSGFRDERDM